MRQTRVSPVRRAFSVGLLIVMLLIASTTLASGHALAYSAIKTPNATNRGTSIVAVHGINAGDGSNGSAINSANNMPGCASYWTDAKNYLSSRWGGDFRQLAYYTNEYDSNGYPCWNNGNDTTESAQLQDYGNAACAGFWDGWDGTNNEDLGHVACRLAWYLNANFGIHGWEVVLVAHSRGGLIVRRMIQLFDQGNPYFPTSIGHITDVIDFNTPQGGVPAGASFACGGCLQGNQMDLNNQFMISTRNDSYGQNPQGGGFTDWTLIGSFCDGLVSAIDATDMQADHKVIYGNPPCYNHGAAIHDTSTVYNANAYYCDTTDPANGCNTDSSSWNNDSYEPHGLEDLYQAIQSYLW